MQAIIIVDCQNDFSDHGSLPVLGGKDLALKINAFLQQLNANNFKFIFSRDWHPINHISFKQWPPHCVANTKGAEYIAPLGKFLPKDLEIRKGTANDVDAYSAFYENYHLSPLNDYLKLHHIETIYVCGLVKDICVLKTLNDGIKMGYKTYLVSDLTIALDEDNYNANVNEKVISITSAELL